MRHADVIIVIGANPTVNHPVAATFIKKACEAFGLKPCDAVEKLAANAKDNLVYEDLRFCH